MSDADRVDMLEARVRDLEIWKTNHDTPWLIRFLKAWIRLLETPNY